MVEQTTDKTTNNPNPVSLATLMTPSKTVTMEYPGIDGLTIDITYLAREELLKLRNRCLKQKFNKKTRQFEEQLDDDRFLTEYVKGVIQGWTGLKYKNLGELLLVDVSHLEPEDELPFSQENGELLMKNSSDFDTWVTEITSDLENFTESKST
jgi:hypothetical protein|tara:strand:- start:103 stop:561 length:459 start_codon:yes stop_codon:yes gene_type:complete